MFNCVELKFVLVFSVFHVLQTFAEGGLVNIGGGCCGTTFQLHRSSKPTRTNRLLLYHGRQTWIMIEITIYAVL